MISLAPTKTNLENYTSWLKDRNLPFIVLDHWQELHKDTKMLILSGGVDVGKNEARDFNEFRWFKQACDRGIPILGICRGMQLINVALGGTLVDDIEDDLGIESHKSFDSGDSRFHSITISGQPPIIINSRHHQCVDGLADGLTATGFSDRIIEMYVNDSGSILGVQWHPERNDVRGTDAEKIVLDWIKEKLWLGSSSNVG